jgi:murein DD-endopeptidase MepM/ murein hydrolase activator NlpD
VPPLALVGTPWGRRLARPVWASVRRFRPRLPDRFRQAGRRPAFALAGVVALVTIVGLVGLGNGDDPPRQGGDGPSAASAAGNDTAKMSRGGSGGSGGTVRGFAPVWVQLLSVEGSIAVLQDEITQQETTIEHLALAGTPGRAESQPAPAIVDAPFGQSDQLAQLVVAHGSTEHMYRRALLAEYDLYRHVAADASTRQQLVQAARDEAPEVTAAVDYDVGVTKTQLDQESAIAAAQQQLQQLTSLSATQLQQIKAGQPFMVPLAGTLTQPFGPTSFGLEPPLVYRGAFYPHFHTGLDLATALDTPLHAAADGVVLLATSTLDGQGHYVGYGNYVLIAHPDGFATLYGHLDRITVTAGQVVHQGDVIGLEGSTGWSTGPHVHFEIRHTGEFVDPAPYLAPPPPR